MCINYYLEALNDIPNKWYIDTCSVMKRWKLEKFIERKQLLLDSGVRIIVLKKVYEELLRKQDSKNNDTAKNASVGFELIKENQDLFEIQGYNQETRCDEAFADREIFMKLAVDQGKWTQVLITDDLDLAYDAYMLNNKKSFYVNKVYVCWINEDGELQRSKGAYEEKPEPIIKIKKEVEIREVEKEVVKTVEVEKIVSHEVLIEKEKTNFEKYGGITVSLILGFTGGYCIGQNKSQLYSLLVNVTNRIRL